MPEKKKDRPRVTATSAASPSKARLKPRSPLTPADLAKLDRIAEAHAVRVVAELKDLVESLAQRAGETGDGIMPDLGIGATRTTDRRPDKAGGADPTELGLLEGLPRHTGGPPPANAGPSERGGARDAADEARPSSDPASWLDGAAGSDYTDPKTGATIQKDGETGTVVKTTTVDHGNGTSTETTTTHNPQTGQNTTHSVTRGPGGTYVVRITENRDGSSDGRTSVHDANGSVTHTWARDASGRFTVDFFETHDRNGRLVDEWDRRLNPPPGLNRLPRDDEGSELGRRLAARFSRPRPGRKPEPDKVNPGDPDDSGPAGPRLDPGDSIVVNPAVAESKEVRQVSAARARHWRNWLMERVGGRVNDEGGGTGRP